MRILLIGSGGQVGWELRRALAPLAEIAAPSSGVLNLSRLDAVEEFVRKARPQVIVNAAAYTAVDAAEKDEAAAQLINGDAPALLAHEAKRLNALLVHFSTDYVFDGRKGQGYVEDDPVAPLSAYGRTKLAGEQGIRDSACRHLIFRTSWVYGARGKNFLLTMLRLARERDELRVVSDQTGAPTWSRMLAEATAHIVGAVERSSQDVRSTCHMSCAGSVSWHGFTERIVEQGAALGLCRKVPVRPIKTAEYPTPAQRPANSLLSNDKLNRDFGVRLPSWELALDLCLADMPQGVAK